MKGRIKFVDGRTGQWGYIVPDDNSADVWFSVSVTEGPAPSIADEGAPVEFDLEQNDRVRRASRIQLMVSPVATIRSGVAPVPGNELKAWAFVPFIPFRTKDGQDYGSILEYLADLALDERWHFGKEPNSRAPFPILDNYLRYTFVRLRKENKVVERGSWATFNTGIVDRLYDPIYALFDKSDRRAGGAPWHFFDFCVPGKRSSGRKLTEIFDPLPEPAKYFNSNFEMILDTSKNIHVDYEHVILDGVSRDRFPVEFVREHLPEGFAWQDVVALGPFERRDFLAKLSREIANDDRCMRAIKRRLEDAKQLAEKRIRWNFKTAIPQYYPRFDSMSLLLPLALINDEVVDIALVVTRNPSGSYQGRTTLPLDWAYKNARLVCRPDSDWLVPQNVHMRMDLEKEEAGEDEGEL